MINGRHIKVEGLVQGVGFRPFVCKLANALSITGSVKNDMDGVVIDAWAADDVLERFQQKLLQDSPVHSRIDKLSTSELANLEQYPKDKYFRILNSESCGGFVTQISDDLAICQNCRADIHNINSRYCGYPFTTCTDCGPRLSVVKKLPYDRDNTSMSAFPMCGECKAEYLDPTSRRFHAQATACQNCGPSIWLEDSRGVEFKKGPAQLILEVAVSKIAEGSIIALKAIGGFRLVCDAGNQAAIDRLRALKQRPHKPFAFMAKNIQDIESYVTVNDLEREALLDASNPIVILDKTDTEILPIKLGQGQKTLGFMLPGSALEVLLFDSIDTPLIMTSANISGDPICSDNQMARDQFSGVIDYFLMNDRDIVQRQDDSVIGFGRQRYTYRRARGLCSEFMKLPFDVSKSCSILAVGSHQKSTFCQVMGENVLLSKDLGDLDSYQSCENYKKSITQSAEIFQFKPSVIVVDKHLGYFSSKYGQDLASRHSLPVEQVQHHHAHVAAVMAESLVPMNQTILGIVLDGLGLGEGQQLWGAEFLLCDYQTFEHYSFLSPVAMPGGSMASKQPLRNLIAHLEAAGVYERIIDMYSDKIDIAYLRTNNAKQIKQLIDKKINSPLASSMGRLFDAVSAALDVVRDQQTFEGQAALALEHLVVGSCADLSEIYTFVFSCDNAENVSTTIELKYFWLELFSDIAAGHSLERIAVKFHKTLIKNLSKQAEIICLDKNIDTIALAGGVFQNKILADHLRALLQTKGLKVITPKLISANDSAISLGQAVICAARLRQP